MKGKKKKDMGKEESNVKKKYQLGKKNIVILSKTDRMEGKKYK